MAVVILPYVEGGSVSYPKRDLTKELPLGMWVVLSFAGRDAKSKAYWNCRCECGTVRVVQQGNLGNGGSVGCGCDRLAMTTARLTTHGKSHTVEYRSWNAMIKRCHDAKDRSYPRYGGRGITVCERWRGSFVLFLEDMGQKPSQKHQIDRYPDNNGNYCPENCRWATPKQNSNNRRSNRNLLYKGDVRNITQWAECAGMSSATLRNRIYNLGWSVEDAIETPVQGMGVPQGKSGNARRHVFELVNFGGVPQGERAAGRSI